MVKAKEPKYPWRVVEGFLPDDDKTPYAYYVVRGEGEEPRHLEFDSHGAYILLSAAQESAAAYNKMGKKSDKYARRIDPQVPDDQLLRMKHPKRKR